MMVSIANVGAGDYLIANYNSIHLFNRRTGDIGPLMIDMGELKSKFVPTAIAVDTANDRVFVANYLGNNVLVGRLDKAKNTFRIEDEIKTEKTSSPEGVSFNGTFLASANFDGSNVQIFQPSAEHWSEKCEIPLAQAHGVAFHGRFLYATSLTDRQIVKIDPESCSIVSRTGSPGWKQGQFLWPTSVSSWDEKSIAVSDAHTGMVSIMDADTLAVSRRFGGNGPGQNGLNMPYGILVEGDTAIVTDTFGGRIVAFNKASGDMAEIWSAKPAWKTLSGDLSKSSLNAEDRDYYLNHKASVTIKGRCYHPDYGALVACDGGERLTLRELNGALLYFVEAAHINDGVIVFSPQAPTGLYYSDSDPEHPRKVSIGFNNWLIDGRLYSPDGEVDLPSLLR